MKLNLDLAQFAHPLNQAEPTLVQLENGETEEVVDLRTSATLMVYAAANEPDNFKINDLVGHLANLEDPEVPVARLMRAIRKRDRAATLRLIVLVEGGLQRICDDAFQS
jgi:hypothetical protein